MANDEASFKREIRESLQALFGDSIAKWTNNDMFVSGLPDDSVHYDGDFFPIESKFVAKLPKRVKTKALKHEVSKAQIEFIEKIRRTGGRGMGGVLVGFKDVAVIMKDLKNNYTLEELQAAQPRFTKVGGVWQLQEIFKVMRGFRDN